MEKIASDAPETRSSDIVAENIQQLKVLFPEAFVEGKVDFEVLRQLLGDELDDRAEKYGLNWARKTTRPSARSDPFNRNPSSLSGGKFELEFDTEPDDSKAIT